jgi:hypothetical protein
LTSINAASGRPGKLPIRSKTRGAVVMSQIDIAYLALVVIAFGGFAVALAYYAHR